MDKVHLRITTIWKSWNTFNSQRGSDKKALFFLVLIILFCLFTISNSRVHIVDDAYIFGRYAYNLAEHGELVFNIGEKVEGITSFLWTILIFFNEFFLHIRFELYVTWLSILLLIILSIRIWYFSTRFQMPWAGLMSVILLFSQPGFLISSMNGLEGGLYGYLLFELMVSFWDRKPPKSFIIGGLLYLTRPESVAILFVVFVIYILMVDNKKELLSKFAIFYLGVVVSITAFRIVYYGEIIPNSVISKSIPLTYLLRYGLTPAYKYTIEFLKNNLIFSLVFLIGFLYLLSLFEARSSAARKNFLSIFFEKLTISRESSTIFLGVFAITFSFLVAFRNGGDWMPAHRLLSQYLPVYIIMILLLLKEKVLDLRVLTSFALISTLFYFSNLSEIKLSAPEIVPRGGFYPDIVNRLNKETIMNKNDLISAEAIGYISYQLHDQPILDPLGLTDKHIARYGYPALQYGKIDIQYVVGQVKPAIMLWHWGGHLKGYEGIVEENYFVFCASDCDGLNADLVIIRKDRIESYRQAFNDLVEMNNLSSVFD